MKRGTPVRRVAGHAVTGVCAVGFITLVCYSLHLEPLIPAFLYLLVVVIESLTGDFVTAALVSTVAAGCLDYFFVPPVLTWNITNPLDEVALVTFLFTSLAITRLASKERLAAISAEGKRISLARLYSIAYRLLSLDAGATGAPDCVRIFREVFGELNAACMFDAATAAQVTDGTSRHGLAERARDAYFQGKDYSDPVAGVSVHCLRVTGELVGAVGFEGLGDMESAAAPLSMLAAVTLERARTFRTASEAAATSQAETLRSAIADAFAHEFKTPLAAILAAAGAIQEEGSTALQHLEMAELIEVQTNQLTRLTNRLLRTARLDKDELKPALERTDLGDLLLRVGEQIRARAGNRGLDIELGRERVDVASDPELLGLALIQVLDNAIRYSSQAGPVTVRMHLEGEKAEVRVKNEGNVIPAEERDLIFDRFYRGALARSAPGTGLGLYVARKIALAHGGSLYLDTSRADDFSTTFCLSLPILRTEIQHAHPTTQSASR